MSIKNQHNYEFNGTTIHLSTQITVEPTVKLIYPSQYFCLTCTFKDILILDNLQQSTTAHKEQIFFGEFQNGYPNDIKPTAKII